MELNKLPGLILMFVMVGMILGVGVLTLGKFADSSAETIAVTGESFTWPVINANVSFAKGNLTSAGSVLNSSGDAVDTGNYTITLAEGRLQALDNTSACIDGATCTVSYSYTEYDTVTKTTTSAVSTAISAIASTWLPLIVIIAALAIIMVLVIRSFARGKR